jgi:FHA domain
MDDGPRYRSLVRLGRQEFLAASAPALFLRKVLVTWPPATPVAAPITEMLKGEDITAPVHVGTGAIQPSQVEVYPLVKKPAAAFPGKITVGRTVHNDVVLANHSISRLHLYVTHRDGQWWIADAGSKNGSWLAGQKLQPRREVPLQPTTPVRIGELFMTFHLASDAYEALGGR